VPKPVDELEVEPHLWKRRRREGSLGHGFVYTGQLHHDHAKEHPYEITKRLCGEKAKLRDLTTKLVRL
jgi:hypothetical protein